VTHPTRPEAPRTPRRQSAGDVRIVLVETAHPGNIGAAARAMRTMGLDRLWLVRPAEFPSRAADERAVAAAGVLAEARVVDRLEAAVGDCTRVFGTAGRPRQHPLPQIEPREAADRVAQAAEAGESVALVFGPERDGLSNADMALCSDQLRIPTDPDYPSLNLGAAVQLVCWEVFAARRAREGAGAGDVAAGDPSARPARVDELEHFFARLRGVLDARAFFDAANSDPTFMRIRRVLGRARPDERELALLHGLVRLMERP